jgi:hypothetical protein
MANAQSDSDCIESAYEQIVGSLYQSLFNNLVSNPGNQQKAVTEFTTGWQLAKQARQLALGVVAPPLAAAKTGT